MKKVLLIQSTLYDNRHQLVKTGRLNFIDLTTPYLAALFGNEWEVEICNEIIEEIPWNTDAQLVGITAMGGALVRGFEIADKFKSMGKTVIMGGFMASLVPEEAKKHCDTVAIGDVENYWTELLNDYLNDNLKPFYRHPITELKHTLLPKYELIAKKKAFFMPVQAGRGCTKNCSFCSIACLYKGKHIQRNIDEIVRDIQRIKELGFRRILMIDDNIIANRTFTIALCKAIKPLKIQWLGQSTIELADDSELLRYVMESGCIGLSFGIETINQDNLNELHKNWCHPAQYAEKLKILRHKGLCVATSSMIGIENDTKENLNDLADFLIQNKIAFPLIGILTPIAGTPYYDKTIAYNKLINSDMHSFSPVQAVINTTHLSAQEIDKLFWDINRKVFSLSGIFKRLIWNRQLLRHPLNTCFYLMVNLYYRYHIKRGLLCQW